jgi:hypothetical protein
VEFPPPKEPPLEDFIVGELKGHISLCFVELPFDISYYHHKLINPNSIQHNIIHEPLETFPLVIAHSRIIELITFLMTYLPIDMKFMVPLLCRVSMWA